MITLLNTNFGRCGSTSLFSMLNNHPRITGSKIKEPVKQGWDGYYNQWDGFQDGHVYMDGTPRLFVKPEFEFVSKRDTLFFTRFCAICVLRNHIDYLVSRMVFENSVRPLRDIEYDLFHQDIESLINLFGRENVFIVNLKDIGEKQNEVYDFLHIDNVHFEFQHLNSSFAYNWESQVKRHIYYRKIVMKHLDKIEDIIERDKIELQKYGIGDLE